MTYLMHTVQQPFPASNPDFDQPRSPGEAVDFTPQQWGACLFTMPSSGKAWLTVSGDMECEPDWDNFVELTFRITGAGVVGSGRSVGGRGDRITACRRMMLSGQPGASVVVRPQWRTIGYASNEWNAIKNGVLLVEA